MKAEMRRRFISEGLYPAIRASQRVLPHVRFEASTNDVAIIVFADPDAGEYRTYGGTRETVREAIADFFRDTDKKLLTAPIMTQLETRLSPERFYVIVANGVKGDLWCLDLPVQNDAGGGAVLN